MRQCSISSCPPDTLFGDVLDAAAQAAGGDVVMKMDDDDWYAPDVVADLLLARGFSGAELVGMPDDLYYLEPSDETVRLGQPSEVYRQFVAGGTLMLDRGLLHEVGGFRSVRRHVDAELIAAVRAAGGATYRTHGLGYVLRRTDGGHTWQADLDDLRARAAQVTPGFWPGRLDGALSPRSPTIPAMRLRSRLRWLPVLPLVLVPLAACAPADDSGSSASDDETTAESTPSEEASESATAATSEEPEAGGISAECAPDQLAAKEAGVLTVGTDKPAYEPWFVDNDPTNGQGFESAVAYAVADTLGMDVSWVTVPFNTSYKPGEKSFDFDINQISITPERAEVVDFSDGYYDASQAVVALKDSDIAESTSIGDLAYFKLGAQTGTTSLTVARDLNDEPAVFEDTNAAKQALLNGQVDGIVADLPTAFYISAAEIEDSVIVGQFVVDDAEPEQFGMLFEKGSSLVACVNEALAVLEADGTLAAIQQQWLSDVVDVPVLQ